MQPGVYTNHRKDGTLYYRSSITFHSKHISLGSFSSESDASRAYKRAGELLNDETYTLEHYHKSDILPFKKWVTLLNFRDNGMYIRTPVYLRKKYFNYYFGPDDFLIFDTDDLFYYSTRTISKRGGHLFVADYGMQVNILSRYGIKNYAVVNRDYLFINGNNRDFRYSNIRIINRFHGVLRREERGKVWYDAKIHWRGDYQIGSYQTETEAAIAYNKAASVLIKKGYEKDYPVNYIETLSKEEYREIFRTVPISERILSLTPLR